MSTYYVSIKYYYKKPGAPGNGTSNGWSGNVQGNTESFLLDFLKKKHKGYEIVIREIKWKE
ncbi:MAG: hypothetical protein HQM10_00250 [Candidatus Riflebacteria bacterium]|nr:hypothetical protein [Candidatus Riflebacteria bacterium]